jgi:hypothetical protein
MKRCVALSGLLLVVFASILAPFRASAQTPGPNIGIWPPSITFCGTPHLNPFPPHPAPGGADAGPIPSVGGVLAGPGAQNRQPINRHPAPLDGLRVPVTITNNGTQDLVLDNIRLISTTIWQRSNERVHGIEASGLPVPTGGIVVENLNLQRRLHRPSSLSATTDCSDLVGNPLPVPRGASCSVFVTFFDDPTAHSMYLLISSNDPVLPVRGVPLLVSRSPGCHQPADAVHFRRDLALPPFIDVLPGEIPPQLFPPRANCRCAVLCEDRSETSGHVWCYTEDTCRECCSSFGNWYCEDADGLRSVLTASQW